MKRTFVRLVACFALVSIALASTNASAGDHGKKRSAFTQSGGGNGSGGGNSPSMKSMKLQSGMSRNFSGLSANSGGGSGNGGNSSFNQFSRKTSKSFSSLSQGNSSLPTIQSNGKFNQQFKGLSSQTNGNTLANPSFNWSGNARRTRSNEGFDKSKLSDTIKQGKFVPLDPGIGNGIETKPGKFPSGKFKGWNPEKLADVIKDKGQFPIGDKAFGDGKKYGPDFGDKFCDTPNQNKKCHDHDCFPWWKLWVNCYPNDCYPNNCYPNDWHCHYSNNCYPPIYYNYPPVTNVTVVNPQPQLPVLPTQQTQPALVDGTDLELVDLRLVDLGDAAKNLGPRYQITLRNRGTLPAGNFQLMLLASADGTPKPGLPSGLAEVAGLASGQLLTVDVRLTLTPELATMTSLIVAADSASQVAETEESNNVAVIDRAKVLMADLAAFPTP